MYTLCVCKMSSAGPHVSVSRPGNCFGKGVATDISEGQNEVGRVNEVTTVNTKHHFPRQPPAFDGHIWERCSSMPFVKITSI